MSTEVEHGARWLHQLHQRLPRHARLIAAIRDVVIADSRLRWFDVCCSLGAGLGDAMSDVDGAVGYAEALDDAGAEALSVRLARSAGDVADLLVHVMDGFPTGVRRVAAEYDDGTQLDLLVMPCGLMSGLRDREVAIVDKDGALVGTATSDWFGAPGPEVAREWALLAWWAVSDLAKYLKRGSRFEAAERIAEVRHQALRLYAAARDVPYPSFGLTSLLDYEPFALPGGLAGTYPQPDDETSLMAASIAVAGLLADCSALAAARLRYDLATPWEASARERLADAVTGR